MLASLVDAPFHTPGWVYEEKYDGYRILAYKEDKRVTLLSRNGKDRTESFADVARAGDWVEARVDVQKMGKRLAFATCHLWVGDRRILRASGIFANLPPPGGEGPSEG